MRNAPDLSPGLELYRTAFFELSSCRSFGMAVGPIPWTAINQYCRFKEFDKDQEEIAHYLIGRMDSFYLEFLSKKRS